MGKGDKRTKRGKITRGSFGKSRPKLVTKAFVPETEPKAEPKEESKA